MLKIGDYAQHLKTGSIGRVIGYGHQILDSAYLPTLKVQLIRGKELIQGSFLEDLVSTWTLLDEGSSESKAIVS
jgi:hypothetical protein